MARRVEVELTPQATERVAVRVAQLLAGRQGQAEPELIGAGELARRLGVERPWVYRNPELLGGIRMGKGPKAGWRFEYEAAVQNLRRLSASGKAIGDR